jgi:TolB-like protein
MSLFTELKRRNVFKVASVYLVTCWVVLQVVAVISPALHLPTLFSTIITVILVIAFPFVCIFTWAFELTPEGLKRTHEVELTDSIREQTGSKINYLLAAALILALAFIAYEKWIAVSADDSLERSIAVLPFADMSPDKSQGYLGDGIAEEILNSLARLNQLVVISRTSSFNFKNTKTDIREIGSTLNVNYILEGSVRKDSDSVRITAQLIEVSSGAHIWSQTYDRELTSIFALQDELTFAITQALKLNLLPEQIEYETGMTTNPQAYELFIEARDLAYQRTANSLKQSAEMLKKAIELDEKFYLAKAQLFMVYRLARDYGGFSVDIQNAEKERLFWALMVAPDFPLKNLMLAVYVEENNKLERDGVSELFAKAYQQAPNDPLIQNLYTLSLYDIEKSIEIRTQILKTNPESHVNYSNLLYLYLMLERDEEAKNLLSIINTKFADSASALSANYFWFYSFKQNAQDIQNYLTSYKGEQGLDFKRVKVSIDILLGRIDEAILNLSEILKQSPESAEQYFSSISLLLDLERNNKLSTEQRQKLQVLPMKETFKTELADSLDLLQGNAKPYVQSNGLADVSSEEFLSKVDSYSIDPFLYAAILKQQGNVQYAEALRPLFIGLLKLCLSDKGVGHWVCLLYMYLDGDYPQDELFSRFQRSTRLLDYDYIGIERFILTSPIYYGVNQHPEFEEVADDLLNRTFQKWVPELVSEKDDE